MTVTRRVQALIERMSKVSQAPAATNEPSRSTAALAEMADLLIDVPAADSDVRPGALLAGSAAPSFHREVMQMRALYKAAAEVKGAKYTPLRQVPRKLANYRYAASHGVAVPTIFGAWRTPRDVPWTDLPDTFVLKADAGASGRSVQALRRCVGGYGTIDGLHRFTPGQLREHWEELARRGSTAGPYFAEELLVDPHGGLMPIDIKIFAFRGEIAHVLLRRVSKLGHYADPTWRFLNPDGTSLAPEHSLKKQDHDIPVPRHLSDLVDVASVLSAHAPFPFMRIDMYEVKDRILVGELTLMPGGRKAYGVEHDRRLGHMWLNAQARLLVDLHRGNPYAFERGPHGDDVVPVVSTS
ncbi:MAG: ATP-grasp fold amidoligase family protein [Ornithinimicrobium sp.]